MAIPHRALACLAAGALGGGLGACGGSSGPSKASFIKQADAICAKGKRDAAALPLPTVRGSKQAQIVALAGYLQSVVPVLQRTATQLRALKSPSQDRGLLQRYLAATDDQVGQAQKLVTSLRAGDSQGIASARAALTQSKASSLASQYGFHDCSTATATG